MWGKELLCLFVPHSNAYRRVVSALDSVQIISTIIVNTLIYGIYKELY